MESRIFKKVVLNFGIGGDENKRKYALKFLESFVKGRKPYERKSLYTSKELGFKKNSIMGIILTIRKERGLEVLRKLIKTRTRIPSYSITHQGAFSFGINNINHIPDVGYYSPIRLGLDVSVTLQRDGARVAKRKRNYAKVGSKNYLGKEEVIEFIKGLGVDCE